jgi:hypothetical protein
MVKSVSMLILEISKASHSASIIASIMHIGPTKMLMWQLIKEERGD